ncbi:MAG: phosphoglycerate kinase [Thaumarchaeota archaeon]|nr:phosphoglycerate kinase [Nitrososphaerota archaeon]
MPAKILTMDDLDLENKRVFVRVDINTPIHPQTGELLELSRLEEAAMTIRDLDMAKAVVASHQGRVGRYDYISMKKHAMSLAKILNKEVQFVEDVFGEAARNRIDKLERGEVLMLDNLRFMAEEAMEYAPRDAERTVLVQRLKDHVDACVLDAFPTAHRAHPSIIGFAELVPTCSGRVVAKELMKLERIFSIEKGPYVTVLGGAKVTDRIEAIDALIANKRADKVLLTGLVGLLFLKANGKFKGELKVEGEQKLLSKAKRLLEDNSDNFELPQDVAVDADGARKEMDIAQIPSSASVLDVGEKTIDHYSKFIRGAGTVFMSGPPGAFEYDEFSKGTEMLLKSMAASFGTTIVSGGHLTASLSKFGIQDSIDHVSTAGGALVQYLAGKRLPLMDALERSARKWSQ